MWAVDTASISASDQNTAIMEARAVETVNSEYAKGVAYSIISQGLCEKPSACVMPYYADPRRL